MCFQGHPLESGEHAQAEAMLLCPPAAILQSVTSTLGSIPKLFPWPTCAMDITHSYPMFETPLCVRCVLGCF